jgi:hypothetical protein
MANNPAYKQEHFRFSLDNVPLATAVPAGQDAPLIAFPTSVNFRLRLEIANTASAGNPNLRLEFSPDGTNWTPVSTSTSVYLSPSTYFADGASIGASQLTATGTYQATGKAFSATNPAGAGILTAGSSYVELLWNLAFTPAAAGSQYQFRVTDNGATTYFTYGNPSPTINVVLSAGDQYAADQAAVAAASASIFPNAGILGQNNGTATAGAASMKMGLSL